MNRENLDYLKSNLKYLGFGEKLYPELEKNVEQKFPEFTLKMQSEYGKDKLEALLYFRKGEQNEMYFFNRYDATFEKANGKVVSQSFYLNKGHGLTLKEAYNLLDGRSVHKDLENKEGEKYQAWIRLDFKQKEANGNYRMNQFHENYGFNLQETLAKFPIKELQDQQQKERLLMSLEKGNMQMVTMSVKEKEEKMFIEAVPQFKTVNIYDKDLKLQPRNSLMIKQHSQSNAQETSSAKAETQKEQKNDDVKKNDRKKQEKKEELLPKKREGKKGLSMH